MPVRVTVRDPDRVNVAVPLDNTAVNVGAPVVTNYGDYNTITNRPRINGVELLGDKSSENLRIVTTGTTAEWAARTDYVPLAGEIIVYTDHDEAGGISVPAVKIGDGSAYAVDLPFVSDDIRTILQEHVADTAVHITAADRDAWNGKVRCYYDENETVVFTTN